MAEEKTAKDTNQTWKLEDIYETDEKWEEDFKRLEEMFKNVPEIKRSLTKSAKGLSRALCAAEEMEHIASYLYVYARMRRDENNANAVYQAMTARAMEINVRLSSALSFISPDLLALKKGVLEGYIKDAEKARDAGKDKPVLLRLLDFDFMLRELLRSKQHVLSAKEERILSMTGEMQAAPKDIYTMLNNADLNFGFIRGQDGKSVRLTHGSFIVLMQSQDREVRKRAFDKLYKTYRDMINTISASYANSVKKDVFNATVRKFKTSLQRALFYDDVPVALYYRLIQIVRENLDIMHDYVAMRKSLLNVEELHMYDIYAPLVEDINKEYTFEEGMGLVIKGLKPLGADYARLLKRAVAERWIDVDEKPGKTSGAYSWGVYGVHPYVLLNHRGDLDSVFTIAHELGHAMHTFYSNLAQPESKANYTIFVAEVASTVNEILLTKHLLSTIKSKKQRRVILNHYLDQFRTTVFRQTMFAEFELQTHTETEEGRPLTHESLCGIYGELNSAYYGEGMVTDKNITYEWARIPHFYNAFYVYKYATGFSSAVTIVNNILEYGQGAVDKYIKFLSSGGSGHPLDLLKIAGVDLLSGEPIKVCMREFKSALSEFQETAE